MTDSESYELAVRSACKTALDAGETSLRELLHAAEGADPSVVFTALGGLHAQGEIDDVLWESLRESVRRAPKPCMPADGPIPHPLDYVWHFDDTTIKALLARVTAASAVGDTIAYLGTPMLHAAALSTNGDRRHVLLDHDPRVVAEANRVKGGSAICVDILRGDLPNLVPRVAVADPPWYAQECSLFVNAAACMLDDGGRLMLAFGSPLTRPSAAGDLDAIVDAALNDGLTLRTVEGGACGYVSPPFERASFELAGLAGVPPDWRRGQLLEFERMPRGRPRRRTMPAEDWVRVDIDEIPLRVRPAAPSAGTSLVSSIVKGDQLVSVSRRDPVREQVALWTSRNRVYGSRDAKRLARLLRRMAGSAATTVDGEERAIAEQVKRIVMMERTEHGLATAGTVTP